MTRHIILAACLALTACASPITRVHDKYNALPFVSDADNYGVSDYWATPMETAGARVARHVAKSRVDHEILNHKNSLAEGWIFQ